MKVVTVLERSDLEELQAEVVVEGWKRKSFGRGKRLYEQRFTEDERKRCEKLYKKFLGWYSGLWGKGSPDLHRMSLDDYQLSVRLCNFFGTEI